MGVNARWYCYTCVSVYEPEAFGGRDISGSGLASVVYEDLVNLGHDVWLANDAVQGAAMQLQDLEEERRR